VALVLNTEQVERAADDAGFNASRNFFIPTAISWLLWAVLRFFDWPTVGELVLALGITYAVSDCIGRIVRHLFVLDGRLISSQNLLEEIAAAHRIAPLAGHLAAALAPRRRPVCGRDLSDGRADQGRWKQRKWLPNMLPRNKTLSGCSAERPL